MAAGLISNGLLYKMPIKPQCEIEEPHSAANAGKPNTYTRSLCVYAAF